MSAEGRGIGAPAAPDPAAADPAAAPVPRGLALQGAEIICVGFSDWRADLLTNQQHLLARAAERNRILFVESLGLRRPQLASRDLSRIARRLARATSPLRVLDGVHVLSPLVLPLHSNEPVRRLNAWLLRRYVAYGVRRLGMRDPILWSFVPQAEVLIDWLAPSKVLYYVDDDHAAKEGIDAESFLAAEERFARRADVVLASAPELVKRMRTLSDNVHYAPNVADTRLFAQALQDGPVDPALAACPGPRIVFVGAILAAKIDIDLVVAMARLRPGWTFAFVGPVGPGDPHTNVDPLRSEANIRLLGPRPYERLPEVLRGADAAIVPYLLEGEMRSVFPMKTYEYLAAGLPVVSTPLITLTDVPDIIKAADAEEFVAKLEEAMAQDSPAERARRSQGAQSHSWEARLDQIAEVLGLSGGPQPRP
jgi:glycosyltransferase involved in cell wall biosynthesis